MVQNLKSLVLRTEITNRSDEQEHNPRSRPQSPAVFLPPASPLPSIEVTTPTGERIPAVPPPFEEPSSYNRTSVSWKEREVEFERQFSFPPRDMPSQPPPAYTTAATQSTTGPQLTGRQRRLNLPKLNPHARVSSINPARSPIDARKWHEKRRNIASIIGLSLCLLLTALLLNYCYILPKLRAQTGYRNDMSNANILTGRWDLSMTQLELIPETSSINDKCSSKPTQFERCVDSRFLSGDDFSFDLTENEDGTFTGTFSEGIFSNMGKTVVPLTPSKLGLMTRRMYFTDAITGKLSSEGCYYQRAAYVLVTFEDGKPIYKITEQQMVSAEGGCTLPQGFQFDSCQCSFVGTKSTSQNDKRR